ncbi:MAG TPA: methyltransferase [Cyclobacteriaceae bacterium]|nr:methyltransferase [Cyclobacteriaceae bacterium]
MRDKSPVMVFKKFSVRHDRVAMKVGTDGVLLGAWTSTENVRNILDVGTGSGLIALMMAQRTPETVTIDAVEVADDAAQAKENFEASPWKHRLSIFHTSLQRFEPASPYDLIVSNPPYFIDSLRPPEERRRLARHTDTLTHEDIVHGIGRMLHPAGRLGLILPPAEAIAFERTAGKHGLHCVRQCAFRSRPNKMPMRYLMEFSYDNSPTSKSEIFLYGMDGKPSEEYRSLTREFYLSF